MEFHDAFRTRHSSKSFPETLHTSIDGEEQNEDDFICISRVGLLALYWAEIADFDDQSIVNHRRKLKWSTLGAFNTEAKELLVSSKYGSAYRGEHGMVKFQSRKNALDSITVELIRNLAAKNVDETRSVFFCYVDSFPISQKERGISWTIAASDAVSALKISFCGVFTGSVKWENLKFLDLGLASSTRLPKPCSKMFSNSSKRPFISLLDSASIKGMDTTYNWSCGLRKNNIKIIIKQAHPPPPNNIFLKNNHMTRETSLNSLLVTIFVVTTFVAALGFSSSTFKGAYSTSKDLITSRLIIAINTLVFIVSLIMDMFLLHKSTYKWELQITLFSLFGAYICLMKVMVPQAAFPLFFLSVPFLFFAAA